MRDFEPEYGTVMRRIATFAGLCTVDVLPARISVFFHAFKSLERLPKLATRSSGDSGSMTVSHYPRDKHGAASQITNVRLRP